MKKKKKTTKVPPVIISNNMFTGVSWDKSSLEVVALVAQGLVNLTELFKSQNITIESMVRIDSEKHI